MEGIHNADGICDKERHFLGYGGITGFRCFLRYVLAGKLTGNKLPPECWSLMMVVYILVLGWRRRKTDYYFTRSFADFLRRGLYSLFMFISFLPSWSSVEFFCQMFLNLSLNRQCHSYVRCGFNGPPRMPIKLSLIVIIKREINSTRCRRTFEKLCRFTITFAGCKK